MASAAEARAPPVVDTRVRCLSNAVRGQHDLVYSKETRHEITESVDVTLHDARALPNDGLEQLRTRGFLMAPFWRDDLHPHLNEYLLNFDKGSRTRGAEGSAADTTERSKEVQQALYQAGAEWAKETLGAKYAFANSHTCRYGNQGHTDGQAYLTSYATFAHCDYTTRIVDGDAGWKALVARGVPEAEAKRMDVGYCKCGRSLRVFSRSLNEARLHTDNIWQSTNGTVEQNPLALSDWSTTEDDDVVRQHHFSPDLFAVSLTRQVSMFANICCLQTSAARRGARPHGVVRRQPQAGDHAARCPPEPQVVLLPAAPGGRGTHLLAGTKPRKT